VVELRDLVVNLTAKESAKQYFLVIFVVTPCIFQIHWLSHTKKCTLIYCTSL